MGRDRPWEGYTRGGGGGSWDDDSGRGRKGNPNQAEIDALYREKDDKNDEIQRTLRRIESLKAEIDQKKQILVTMRRPGMESAYESLDNEIAGLVMEKKSEQQAIADLKDEIKDINDDIKRLKQK